eukprot:TRINITY_DN2456_c2_g1_i1.p2 TRINITY_DN2456_c2_g1~~TRINITY_DN2456_c2_g1_i1.p2  ORF type:complete len:159 (-),score=50.25 TRINITY_DN2456_c2_g1_i1:65-475(-)
MVAPAHLILAAACTAYLPHWYKFPLLGLSYNNKNPRQPLASAPAGPAGTRLSRAAAAHQNGLEVVPLFAAAVLSAQVAGAPAAEIERLGKLFVASRLVYNWAYITGETEARAALRSAVWMFGIYLIVRLFLARKAA